MTKLAWATDVHLNSVNPSDVEAFCTEVKAAGVEGLLLSGDIAEAESVVRWLTHLHSQLKMPIYFVLGNHDYYGGSVREVRDAMRALDNPELLYLTNTGPIRLAPDVTLVGNDGWGDCRIGDLEDFVDLTDYIAIEELRDTLDWNAIRRGIMDRTRLRAKLRSLGDDAAATLSPQLVRAAESSGSVLVMTHVPPFKESCWYDGSISAPTFLPGFSCKAVGDLLSRVAQEKSATRFTVLCGHTHGHGHAQILPNLQVHTGFGTYRALHLGFVDIDGADVTVQAPAPQA